MVTDGIATGCALSIPMESAIVISSGRTDPCQRHETASDVLLEPTFATECTRKNELCPSWRGACVLISLDCGVFLGGSVLRM